VRLEQFALFTKLLPEEWDRPTVSAADLDQYDGQTARCDQFQHCSNASTTYLRRMSIAGKTPVKADRQLTTDGKLAGGRQPIQPW